MLINIKEKLMMFVTNVKNIFLKFRLRRGLNFPTQQTKP